MNIIKFIISAILCIGLIIALNQPIPLGKTNIPPLGKILSPKTGFWKNAATKEEARTITLDLPELKSPVKVVYDKRQIPHIFAENTTDAFFAQGYIIAQNRLWQMDIATRAASGRLSEIMGERTLKRDRLQRKKGVVFGAENTLKVWKQSPLFTNVEAYAQGVNAYIQTLKPADYPIEFKLLNYQPEPWTPLKTALYLKSMAEVLATGEKDLERTNAIEFLGKEIYNELYEDKFEDEYPIIPNNTPFDFSPIQANPTDASPALSSTTPYTPYEKHPEYLGSNNWAVSGSKTKSGYPILCNDPHLGLSLPSVWYELQIITPEFNAYGVALPGVPSLVLGFNKHAAWGFTNVGQDVLDWYAIDWAKEDKTAYILDGKEEKTNLRIEEIKILGAPSIKDTVYYTYWGPVVYSEKGKDLAMRWTAHQSQKNELNWLLKMPTIKSYNDYRDAIQYFCAPAQNILFANQEGDISITAQGSLPILAEGQGLTIQNGNTRKNDWAGYIPSEHLASIKNPSSGYITSANQRTTDDSYPYYYHHSSGSFEGYRGRVANLHLDTMKNITIEDMKNLQNDVYNLKAAEALPLLIATIDQQKLDPKATEYLQILKEWDFQYTKSATAPILFEHWVKNFYTATWDEIYELDGKAKMIFPSQRKTIELLKKDPQNEFFDLKKTEEIQETASNIANTSFHKMVKTVEELESKGNELKWADYRKVKFNHIGFIPAFSRNDLKVAGTHRTLQAIGESWGPSWKMIVEFGPKGPTAVGIYPGGQSGNPGSPYYDNTLEDWANGQYYPLEFME